jgi:hypothetical protein
MRSCTPPARWLPRGPRHDRATAEVTPNLHAAMQTDARTGVSSRGRRSEDQS